MRGGVVVNVKFAKTPRDTRYLRSMSRPSWRSVSTTSKTA